jgi:aspartate/methionine/tyrosine aminotransferase
MKIKPFGVEIWMNRYENECRFNLAETCVESLTFEQLLEITGKKDTLLAELLPIKLGYGAIEGSDRLRNCVAAMFTKQSRDNVVIAHGGIGANALVYATLVEPRDEVISVLPTYQQHYSIPESYGATVKILPLREENGFLPDINELKALVTPKTKIIAINNPNNPTGSLMNEALLRDIANIAADVGAYIVCDEVYRGMDRQGNGTTVSIADLYDLGISTGSMSKAFSLAGLRLGWIVGPSSFIHDISIHRDYNTISVGILDDYFAIIALENRQAILDRSRRIVNENLAILESWIESEPRISFIKPNGGTTALLKYNFDMPSEELCLKLMEHSGVLFTPGSAMEVEGYVRIGYTNNKQALEQGLKLFSKFMDDLGF